MEHTHELLSIASKIDQTQSLDMVINFENFMNFYSLVSPDFMKNDVIQCFGYNVNSVGFILLKTKVEE